MSTTQAYLSHLRERGCSENTVAAYRNDLTQLEQWLVQLHRSPEVNWRKVTRADLIAYDDRLGGTCAAATRHRKRASALSFTHWLTAEGIVRADPLERGFPKLGFTKPLPQLLTAEEIAALLAAPLAPRSRTREHGQTPKLGATPTDLRDDAMLRLLKATGLRVSELVALDADDDLDLSTDYVRVARPGGRERCIPFDFRTHQALGEYLGRARPALKPNGTPALFLNHRGERLTRQGFWLILRQHAKSAGIAKRVTPHALRHSFAVALLADNASLRDVQELLGHANLATTQIYTTLTNQRRAS